MMTDERIAEIEAHNRYEQCLCCEGEGTHDPECTLSADVADMHEQLSVQWERARDIADLIAEVKRLRATVAAAGGEA